jgi:hypothetical protein
VKRVLLCYAAGAAGAFANTLLGHLLSQAGLMAALGTRVLVPFGPPSLYTRLVWGGLWGLLLVLPPLMRMKPLKAGLLVSLAPSAAPLFYFFPRAGAGLLGESFGLGTPLAVLALNAVWGVVAAHLARDGR